jgi:hypothetical protein
MPNPQLCSIPDCGNPKKTRGLCRAHYARWLKYGDAKPSQKIRPPGGHAMAFIEEALKYDGDECILWPYGTKNGYAKIGGDSGLAHRLVCKRAHGDPPTKEHDACHSCGNGQLGCVTKKHLRWGTHQENMADMLIHGTIPRGTERPNAKLNDENIREIRKIGSTMSQREIADKFGISQGIVSEILTGKRWTHVSQYSASERS